VAVSVQGVCSHRRQGAHPELIASGLTSARSSSGITASRSLKSSGRLLSNSNAAFGGYGDAAEGNGDQII
jgi:hypothetical protein